MEQVMQRSIDEVSLQSRMHGDSGIRSSRKARDSLFTSLFKEKHYLFSCTMFFILKIPIQQKMTVSH